MDRPARNREEIKGVWGEKTFPPRPITSGRAAATAILPDYRQSSQENPMTDEANRRSVESQVDTALLMGGYIYSALLVLAASILWAGFIIAATWADSAGLKTTSGSIAATAITLVNAAMFYIWGFNGLLECRKAQKTARAKKALMGMQS
jgi:hypothetical protein